MQAVNLYPAYGMNQRFANPRTYNAPPRVVYPQQSFVPPHPQRTLFDSLLKWGTIAAVVLSACTFLLKPDLFNRVRGTVAQLVSNPMGTFKSLTEKPCQFLQGLLAKLGINTP